MGVWFHVRHDEPFKREESADTRGTGEHCLPAAALRHHDLPSVPGFIVKEVDGLCHFQPGTSKWKTIELRRVRQIAVNRRGRPLTSLEVIV